MEKVDSKKIITYIVAAVAFLAAAYFPLLLDFFKPIFAAEFDVFAPVIISSLKAIIYFVLILLLIKFAERFTGLNPFKKQTEKISFASLMICYAFSLGMIFFICLSLDFNSQFTYIIGTSTSVAGVIDLALGSLLFMLRFFFALTAIVYLDEVFEKVFKLSEKFVFSFGALVVTLTFGAIEFFAEFIPMSILNLPFIILYGMIYRITGKRFFPAYLSFLFVFLV